MFAGFVNVSVRTITNARQVGVRLQSKCNSTHRHAGSMPPLQRLHGRRGNRREDFVHAGQASKGGKWEPRFSFGVFVGTLNSSSEAVVVTEQGLAIKTRAANVRSIPESESWDTDRILGMRAVAWSPDGSDSAFDIQVGMERPAEMVFRSPGDVLMENEVARTHFRRKDF